MALKKGFDWRRVLKEECEWDVFTQEILPRLPVNQLLKFKRVCKNWYQIISSPCFIRLHLNMYNQNQNQIRVLMPITYCSMLREYKINCDGLTEQEIPYPPAIRNWESTILGSCDGLLCLLLRRMHEHHKIAVYNPSTGKYLFVESPLEYNCFISCSWFGHHPCSGKYVLVLGYLGKEVGVYKFITRRSNTSLEKIHSTSTLQPHGVIGFHDQRIGTLLHGALHWPLIYRYSNVIYYKAIAVYHLDDNKYFEFAAPVQRDIRVYHFKLGVAEGCLIAFFRPYDDIDDDDVGVLELWIMKEYKVHQSWTKYADIRIRIRKCRVVGPLAFFPNGNDLILHPNKPGVIKCTFNDNKVALLMDYEYGGSELIMCADSLVSPEIVVT